MQTLSQPHVTGASTCVQSKKCLTLKRIGKIEREVETERKTGRGKRRREINKKERYTELKRIRKIRTKAV